MLYPPRLCHPTAVNSAHRSPLPPQPIVAAAHRRRSPSPPQPITAAAHRRRRPSPPQPIAAAAHRRRSPSLPQSIAAPATAARAIAAMRNATTHSHTRMQAHTHTRRKCTPARLCTHTPVRPPCTHSLSDCHGLDSAVFRFPTMFYGCGADDACIGGMANAKNQTSSAVSLCGDRYQEGSVMCTDCSAGHYKVQPISHIYPSIICLGSVHICARSVDICR